MWIKKILKRSVLWWKTLPFSNRTTHDHDLAKLQALDPQLFVNYKTATACVFPVKVLYKNFEAYHKRLKHVNYLLANKIAIANSWCHYEWTQTSLDGMWTTYEGIRTHPIQVVEEFKTLALTFIQQYELIKDEQIDTDGHNARMLATFKTSVLLITDSLLAYSLS